MAKKIGTIGEQIDLTIKQGCTFGPIIVTLRNPDKSPMDLTSCTIESDIRHKALDIEKIISFNIDIVLPETEGQYSFGLTDEDTATIPAGESISDEISNHVWDMKLIDSQGRAIPLYYGNVKVFRDVTRETI